MRIASITQAPMDELGGLQAQARWINGVVAEAGHQVDEIWPPLRPWQRHPVLFALAGEIAQEWRTRRAVRSLAGPYELAIGHGSSAPRGIPAISVFHNSIEEYARYAYPRWHPNHWKLGVVNAGLERLHAAERGFNVAVSETQAQGLRRLGIRVDRVIPNPIDPSEFNAGAGREAARAELGWPQEAFIALAVGRPARGKGWDRLARLAAAFPDVRFCCAGPAQAPIALANLRALGPVDRARMPLHYQAADLFLSLSVAEGFGLALGEAIACGVPFFATPTGLGGDLLAEGGVAAAAFASRDGRDDIERFARLRESPALRAEIAEAGSRFVAERAAPGRVRGEYLSLIDSAAAL